MNAAWEFDSGRTDLQHVTGIEIFTNVDTTLNGGETQIFFFPDPLGGSANINFTGDADLNFINMTLTQWNTSGDISLIDVLGSPAVVGTNLTITEYNGTGVAGILLEPIGLGSAAIPEPSTFVLAGIGLLGLVTCGRQRNRRRA